MRPAGVAVSARQLEEALTTRVTQVQEFHYLRELCSSLKVRCWLFGGTAAGYGHYVKWDLLRKGGDSRFQPDRFDYDYTNIYRSTQDADIVIDGPAEKAEEIERRLRETFPHFQGKKQVWEVRLLSEARGDKEALLNNADFLNQHTDSNSTGMIEVTRPPEGESAVRDLRDWQPERGKTPQFFRDIHEGKLHYYYSDLHAGTSRARKGLNPPIFSAVRFLTKAFQYELEIRPEDWAAIRKVVDEFDPARDLAKPYTKDWLDKNGKKIFQHAVNLEYAWNKLEELGLRKKLIAVGGSANTADSLAWWMNKEPLRSAPIGQGSGKTATELRLSTLAHETTDFLAYESITRAHTGEPNVLISRRNVAGEVARFGDGFYTAVGKRGAKDTKITIRFTLHPGARQGTDFELVSGTAAGDFVRVLNKNAIRVIPESLNVGPVEAARLLLGGEIDTSDRALMEKFKRRMRSRAHLITDGDRARVLALLRRSSPHERPLAFAQLLQIPGMERMPRAQDLLLEFLIKSDFNRDLARVLEGPAWQTAIDSPGHPIGARHPEMRVLLEAFRKVSSSVFDTYRAELVDRFADGRWAKKPTAQAVMKAAVDKEMSAIHRLSDPRWARTETAKEIFAAVLRQIKKHFSNGWDHQATLEAERLLALLQKPGWANSTTVELLGYLLSKTGYDDKNAWYHLRDSRWAEVPEAADLMRETIEHGRMPPPTVFRESHWIKHPRAKEWITLAASNPRLSSEVAAALYPAEWVGEFAVGILRDLIRNPESSSGIEILLAAPHWYKSPLGEELAKLALGNPQLRLSWTRIFEKWSGSDEGLRLLTRLLPEVSDPMALRIAEAFTSVHRYPKKDVTPWSQLEAIDEFLGALATRPKAAEQLKWLAESARGSAHPDRGACVLRRLEGLVP